MSELSLQCLFLLWLLTVNLLLFALIGVDKIKARKRHYRIPERLLLASGLLGGGIGGLLGMRVFRHKTKHNYFYVVYGIGTALWIGIWMISF